MMGEMAIEALRAYARLRGLHWHFAPDLQMWTLADKWHLFDTERKLLESIHSKTA